MKSPVSFTVETVFKVKGTLTIFAHDEIEAIERMVEIPDERLIADSDLDMDNIEVDEVNII